MPTYSPYPMVLNGVFLGMVDLRSDQINYFDIPAASAAEQAFTSYLGEIKAHTRKVYSTRLDSATSTREINVDKKINIPRKRRKNIKGRGGRPIKVPTELTSTPSTPPSTTGGGTIRRPSVRMTTIKFPSGASLSEISAWLHLKLVSKKPTYMQSPSGQAYPIGPMPTGAQATPQTATP